MNLKIYGSPLSQPTRAVLWTLKALNIDYEFVRIRAGDQFTQEFKKLNPNCKFPVLVENEDFVLDESHAIMKYVALMKPKSSLLDLDAKSMSMVDKWLDWKHTYLRPGACGIVRRRVLIKFIKDKTKHSMFQDFDEIIASREVRILTESLDILESHLKAQNSSSNDKLFLVKNFKSNKYQPTLADIALVTEIDQLCLLEACNDYEFLLDKKWPLVKAWVDNVKRKVKGYDEVHEGLRGVEKKLKDENKGNSKL